MLPTDISFPGHRKGAEAQRENLDGEGNGHTLQVSSTGNAGYALTFVNLPSHTFVLAFTLLSMLTGTMHPQVLLPWRPLPCAPHTGCIPWDPGGNVKSRQPQENHGT